MALVWEMEEYKSWERADRLAAGPGPGVGEASAISAGKREVQREFPLLVLSPTGTSRKKCWAFVRRG